MMDKQKHIERHKELHQKFDELLADFIGATGGLPSQTTLKDMITWSYQQTIEPDHEPRGLGLGFGAVHDGKDDG